MSKQSNNQIETYLAQLSAELSALPKQQQTEILDEIRAHIEDASAESDNNDEATLLSKMGDVTRFGANMQTVYRPRRLFDFLLCTLPIMILPLLVNVIVAQLYPINEMLRFQQLWLAVLYLPVIIFGVRRNSAETSLFWLSAGIVSFGGSALRNELTMGANFGISWAETGFFALVCLGLMVVFGRTLRQHRDDPLLLMWALLPFISSFIALASTIAITRVISPSTLGERVQIQAILQLVLTPIAIGLFILPTKREQRWLAHWFKLAGIVVSASILFWTQHLLNPFYLAVVAVVALVAAIGWMQERRYKRSWWHSASA